jgi:hypothetical protein
MRLVAAGDDERGDVEAQEVLRLRARRRVAVEEDARHGGDDELVFLDVELRVSRGERAILLQDRRPRAAARIGAEGLAVLRRQVDHGLEAVLLHEREVLGETLLALDAIFRAADGPPEDHAHHRLRMRRGECDRDGATHAAADEMRALDLQVAEEAASLGGEVLPGDALDAPPRLPRLAPVVSDAHEFLRQVLEELHARVDAERGPLLDGRVEASRGKHQERRTRADHLVAGRDAVEGRGRHRATSPSAECRP